MRRIAVPAAIAAFFALVLYTTNGCGGSYQPRPANPSVALRGNVLDDDTSEPVAGAELRGVQDGKAYVVQTVGGVYLMDGPHAGDLLITVSAPGYETQTKGATVVNGYNNFDFRLRRVKV
jgi:hypothetical protein